MAIRSQHSPDYQMICSNMDKKYFLWHDEKYGHAHLGHTSTVALSDLAKSWHLSLGLGRRSGNNLGIFNLRSDLSM